MDKFEDEGREGEDDQNRHGRWSAYRNAETRKERPTLMGLALPGHGLHF